MSSPHAYPDNYVESLETLPREIRRNLTLMHELDIKNQEIMKEVDEVSVEYLRSVKSMDSASRKQAMEKIQRMFQKAKAYGDDKVSIAFQAYEMVDKHIRRLDSDLTKLETQIGEKSRLSQVETEDDGDGTDTKKKGRKKLISLNSSALKDQKSAKKRLKKDSSINEPDDPKKSKKKFSVAPRGTDGVITVPPGGMDMPVDPNEPTYCICQQVSYGEMIGCDNPDCHVEWFHFGCIKLVAKPKGKWYCPKCLPMFKKKK